MIINTASEGITLAKKLENDSAALYESLARQYPQDAETLLSFAKENKKNIVQIERTYYGVITDAIEGCFAFNLDPGKYIFDMVGIINLPYKKTLNKAIEMEEKMTQFYNDAAKQCESLMADIPMVFSLLAGKSKKRIQKIVSL